MLFVFTSEQAVSPPSPRPTLSTEASEKCPAGRWSPTSPFPALVFVAHRFSHF